MHKESCSNRAITGFCPAAQRTQSGLAATEEETTEYTEYTES